MSPERVLHSRRDLTRVLGLSESAPDEAIRTAAARLLAALRRRQQARAGAHDPALAREIAALESAVARTTGGGDVRAPADRVARAASVDRRGLATAMLGVALMLALLIAYASGLRVVRREGGGFAASLEEPATLMLMGRLPHATLRVLDADREELFVETAAQGAVVELRAGRYAIEVVREDCPDRWTRSVFFEPGATHRFEPYLCSGEGQVVVRSNVPNDRLLIDGLDVGATGSTLHTLSVGDHEIRVEKTGYEPFEGRVRIAPEDTIELRAELAPTGPKQSRRQPDLPFAVEAPDLRPEALPRPEPFDLGSLQQDMAPKKSASAATRLLARAAGPGLPDGGSTAWHDRISRELLSRFDSDRSGLIDRLEESEAIGCPLWLEIEREFDRGGLGLSMARYYGFDGSEWHDKALGFARGMRGAAYAKMKECGLQIQG